MVVIQQSQGITSVMVEVLIGIESVVSKVASRDKKNLYTWEYLAWATHAGPRPHSIRNSGRVGAMQKNLLPKPSACQIICVHPPAFDDVKGFYRFQGIMRHEHPRSIQHSRGEEARKRRGRGRQASKRRMKCLQNTRALYVILRPRQRFRIPALSKRRIDVREAQI